MNRTYSYRGWELELEMNRVICNVFEEMRKANETRNYSYLEGLIEEAQSMANRMESAIFDMKDIKSINKEWKKAKAKGKFLRELEAKEKELEDEQV